MIHLVAVVKGLGLPVHLRRARWGDRLTCNRCPRPLPRLCLQCCTCVRGLFRGCHLRPLGGSRAVVERSFWNTSWTWTCSSKVWWSRACLPQRWSLCSILASDGPFCGFCTCRLFQRKNKPGTCRSWNTWGIGTGIHIWETACKCCTLPRVWLILQPQTCEGQATTPCSAALVSSTRESWQPITREHRVRKLALQQQILQYTLEFCQIFISFLVCNAWYLYKVFVSCSFFETALDRWVYVGAPKSRQFAQHPRDLDAVVKEEAKLSLRCFTVLIRDQTEHVYNKYLVICAVIKYVLSNKPTLFSFLNWSLLCNHI